MFGVNRYENSISDAFTRRYGIVIYTMLYRYIFVFIYNVNNRENRTPQQTLYDIKSLQSFYLAFSITIKISCVYMKSLIN